MATKTSNTHTKIIIINRRSFFAEKNLYFNKVKPLNTAFSKELLSPRYRVYIDEWLDLWRVVSRSIEMHESHLFPESEMHGANESSIKTTYDRF